MSGILAVGEVVDGRLADATAEAITAAGEVGGPVVLGVPLPKGMQLPALPGGVEQVLTASVPAEGFDPELVAQAVRALMEHVSPELVLGGFTLRAASFAAALAASEALGFAADVVALRREDDGTLVATRPVYAGRVHAEVELPADRGALVLLRPAVWQPASDSGVPASVTELALPATAGSRVRHLQSIPPAGEVDLTRAEVIFSVGRGVGGAENIPLFADLAAKAGAALGASRPVVDAGWLPAAHQVGQTGVAVKPRLYVAFGISGALQHLAGIQGAKTVVAVNTDKDAPIFRVADLGAVADIFEVAEHLQALL